MNEKSSKFRARQEFGSSTNLSTESMQSPSNPANRRKPVLTLSSVQTADSERNTPISTDQKSDKKLEAVQSRVYNLISDLQQLVGDFDIKNIEDKLNLLKLNTLSVDSEGEKVEKTPSTNAERSSKILSGTRYSSR